MIIYLLLSLTVSFAWAGEAGVSSPVVDSPGDGKTGDSGEKSDIGGVRGIVRGMIVSGGQVFYLRMPKVKAALEFTRYSSETGTDGRFFIDNIPPGKYNLVVKAEGMEDQTLAVEIKPNNTANVGNITFLMGVKEKPPLVIPGSLVAAFSGDTSSKDKKISEELPSEPGDTPTSSLVFYDPVYLKAYLEMVLKDRPVRITFGPDGKKLYLATAEQKIEVWDLDKMELKGRASIPGLITDMQWNQEGTKLYISFFNNRFSGILIFDGEKGKATQLVEPPPLGVIGGIFPFPGSSWIFAVISRMKDGRLVLIDLKNPAGPLVTRNRTVGDLPTDLTYLPRFNNLFVVINQGSSVALYNGYTFKLKFMQVLEGKPGRIIKGLEDAKVYVTMVDIDKVAILDGEKGNVIGRVKVGRRPYFMCKKDHFILVGNYLGRNISVIDARVDQPVHTTPPEEFHRLECLEVMPVGD